MVRTVVASESFLAYLTSVAKADSCIVGLILGQHTPSKDYVIHFAKTPPSAGDSPQVEAASKIGASKGFKNLTDITNGWVAEHARHTTRLLPGGMHVLGIFILANQNPYSGKNLEKTKEIVKDVHLQLTANKYLYGNCSVLEKLVLHYAVGSRTCACKSFDPLTGSMMPVEFKFLSNKIGWQSVECFYELSNIYPIQEKEDDLSLKKHMSKVLQSITKSLKSAVFLFNGETKSEDDYLDGLAKKSKLPSSESEKSVQVTIILPSIILRTVDAGMHHIQHSVSWGEGAMRTTPTAAMILILLPPLDLYIRKQNCSELSQPLEIRSCAGHIKLSGQIASKIWVSPTMTVGEISKAIVQDILRSLEARLEMHWDSLIEEEHGSPEDTNSIHEPPRRIFVKLPGTDLTLSDYLFPGEGPQEATISLEELLDITVNEKEGIIDAEGQADLTEFYNEKLEVESEDNLPKLPTETSKFMYMVGLGIALLVLLISLLVHFLQNA